MQVGRTWAQFIYNWLLVRIVGADTDLLECDAEKINVDCVVCYFNGTPARLVCRASVTEGYLDCCSCDCPQPKRVYGSVRIKVYDEETARQIMASATYVW